MKLTNLASASVIIEHGDTKILVDPWLEDGEFYGSWFHYPPLNLDYSMFDDVDYIYISHIHPDHLSKKTLNKINKNIPVLIHKWDSKFVKNNLEKVGRKVIELNHGEKFHCGDNLYIKIYSADNCNPALCDKMLGCGKVEKEFGSTNIDTMCVFECDGKTILNINDCPYELSEDVLDLILREHKKIDVLLVGYTGAGAYPQCWDCYTEDEKVKIYGPNKKKKLLNMGLQFLNKVNPINYMPFAGTYTLGGSRHHLESLKGTPKLSEALEFYEKFYGSGGFLLNQFESFNLETKLVSKEYVEDNDIEKQKYILNVLSHKKYDYEYDPNPILTEFENLLPMAYNRFNNKRKQLDFTTDTNVYVILPDKKCVKISFNGGGYSIIDSKNINEDNKRVVYDLDHRLLYRILRGPRHAHWNNAEIGSHINFYRKPEIYERALYYCMNFFHK